MNKYYRFQRDQTRQMVSRERPAAARDLGGGERGKERVGSACGREKEEESTNLYRPPL